MGVANSLSHACLTSANGLLNISDCFIKHDCMQANRIMRKIKRLHPFFNLLAHAGTFTCSCILVCVAVRRSAHVCLCHTHMHMGLYVPYYSHKINIRTLSMNSCRLVFSLI